MNESLSTPERAILEINNLQIRFPLRKKKFVQSQDFFYAVHDVNLSLSEGETLGVVGESGCGKTTLARAIMHLVPIFKGTVFFDNKEWGTLRGDKLRERRNSIQMVFQNPYASLNPRMTIFDTLKECLPKCDRNDKQKVGEKIVSLLTTVGLDSHAAKKFPHEFSGGQRQRIALARALAMSPKMIIADEPVSSLDVSIQAQIINLLADIQCQGLTLMFISHDLAVVKYISHKIAVMYQGKIVEYGTTSDIFEHTSHPYTRVLIDSIPSFSMNTIVSSMDDSNSIEQAHWGRGCAFHPRCKYAQDICRKVTPEIREITTSHSCMCHFNL